MSIENMRNKGFYNKSVVDLREDFFNENNPSYSNINELFLNLISANTPRHGKILDVGTGNAFVLEQLINKNRQEYSEAYGIDNSKEMLEKAKERTRGLAVKLILADNFKIPFQDEYFDSVTAKNVTNFSESEVYRVLKKGGKFFFKEYGPGKGLEEIAKLFPGRLVRSRTPKFYTDSLRIAGFTNVQLKEFKIKNIYSYEKLVKVLNMFPFMDKIDKSDIEKIKKYFGNKEKTEITSHQIIIVGGK